MKKILLDEKIQLIVSILILIGSFILNALQGVFGFFLPFAILIFLILTIILIYYVISKPLLNAIYENKNKDSIHTLEQIKNYEVTGDFKEIWIVTSDLKMAADKKQFMSVIQRNIKRGVKYKFYINNTALAKERAREILDAHRVHNDNIRFYCFNDSPVFIDNNTDYDLFFCTNPMYNNGFIGITINSMRNYITMPQELFINLKIFLEGPKAATLIKL